MHGLDSGVFHPLAIQPHALHMAGRCHLAYFGGHVLAQHHKAGYLDSAAGTACTCTGKHYHHEYELAPVGPGGKVHRAKACCTDKTRHIEKAVTQALSKTPVHIGHAQRNGQGRSGYYAQIPH